MTDKMTKRDKRNRQQGERYGQKEASGSSRSAVYADSRGITVSTWAAGLHRYDLRYSFSEYVGFRYTTSVIYFIAAVIMLTMLSIYIFGLKIHKGKKALYAAVYLCILGAAFFPCSYKRSELTTDIHNYFAIGLMLLATVTFVVNVITAKAKAQRITAVLSLLYATAFIAAFAVRVQVMFDTFFVWENVFIYLLLTGIWMEYHSERIRDR